MVIKHIDLRTLFVEPGTVLSGDTPVFWHCPNHNDQVTPNLAIYEDHAYCYACGEHFTYQQVIEGQPRWAVTAASLREGSGLVRRKSGAPVKTLEEVRALAKSSRATLSRESMVKKVEYLEARGINQRMVSQYYIGHYGLAYTLPIFDGEGAIVSIRFRRDDDLTKDPPKYFGLAGHNHTMVYPFPPLEAEKAIILTEGEFDALLLRRYGLPAYSLTNGANAGSTVVELEHLLGRRHILLVRDQDGPGREGTAKLGKLLDKRGGGGSREFKWVPGMGKDITEVWQQDIYSFSDLTVYMRRDLVTLESLYS